MSNSSGLPDGPSKGSGFPSSETGWMSSNDGYDFGFSVAAYKAIGGDRENLEIEPDRILTDDELQNADMVVVHFTGAMGYKTFAGGPWEDWQEFWDDLADYYDSYMG